MRQLVLLLAASSSAANTKQVNDKVRQTFGQNPPNFQTKSAKLSLSQLILAYLSLLRRVLSISLADFIQKFGGLYLPHEKISLQCVSLLAVCSVWEALENRSHRIWEFVH